MHVHTHAVKRKPQKEYVSEFTGHKQREVNVLAFERRAD
jgi:hypothetical protein